MSKAEVPDNARCPDCGAKPTEDQIDRAKVHDRLSNIGYKHGDFKFDCPECDTSFTHGVPVGEFDGGTDLWCDPCEEYFYVHRVKAKGPCSPTDGDDFHAPDDGVLLHLKCPGCFRFKKVKRDNDRRGVALIGYPPITGEVDDDTRPYGYESEPPE